MRDNLWNSHRKGIQRDKKEDLMGDPTLHHESTCFDSNLRIQD